MKRTKNTAVLPGLTTRACAILDRAPPASDGAAPKPRTKRAILFTEEPAEVMDWESFEIIDEVLLASGAHVPAHMPLFDDHMRHGGARSVMGSVTDPVIGKASGEVLLTFDTGTSPDADEETLWRKVDGGHLRAVSVGYRVRAGKFTDILPGQTLTVAGRTWTARNARRLRISQEWDAKEGSVVPIGADENAQIRAAIAAWNGRTDMGGENKSAAAEAPEGEEKRMMTLTEIATAAGLSVDDVLAAVATHEAAKGDATDDEETKAEDAPKDERAAARILSARAALDKAKREAVMAFAPESLRAHAEGLLLRGGLDVAQIRAALLAEQVKRSKPVGTDEPPPSAPPKKPTVTADEFARSFGIPIKERAASAGAK